VDYVRVKLVLVIDDEFNVVFRDVILIVSGGNCKRLSFEVKKALKITGLQCWKVVF
jgi:hypothetical protein